MTLAGSARAAVRAAQRARFVARVSASARLAGADIDLRISPTAEIGRGVRVRIAPSTRGALHVGPHSAIGDAVEIRLNGGELRIGDWVEVRRGVAFMVGGTVEITGQNVLSWGMTVHCDERVHLARQATFGEYVTITDSVHQHREGSWHVDHITTSPVSVGSDTWVGAKATIAPGVTVGERCIVAAGAVVTRDVPADHVALGVPAVARPR